MDIAEIFEVINKITLGDKLVINDWKAKYTVCGISPNFILAHYGQHYTIVSRKPWQQSMFNGVRTGDAYCAPDWWIFGYMDGYDFTNEDWVKKYLADLESGDTEMSQRKHAPIYFISVVGHVDKVYRMAK